MARTIHETIKIHDKYHFELKLGYLTDPKKKKCTYDIETYFFIPSTLNINRHSYSKKDFYNDLTSYIRLKTPSVKLDEIAYGPISHLKHTIFMMQQKQNKKAFSRYEHSTKMFCCVLKSSLRDHVSATTKPGAQKAKITEEYIAALKRIIPDIRDIRKKIIRTPLPMNIKQAATFCDEYSSLLIERYTFKLMQKTNSLKHQKAQTYRRELLGIIGREIAYRKHNKYKSVIRPNTDNEELLFIMSALKKYAGSALYLDTTTKKAGKIVEHAILATAAAIAMAFATAAAFFSQARYGNFTFPFFAALVVSYIFKDRIKDWTKHRLKSKISKKMCDYEMNIYGTGKKRIGFCKETFTFLEEKNLPLIIRRIRNRQHITEVENFWHGEKIFIYRKHMQLFSLAFSRRSGSRDVQGINDIIRFNMTKFLQRMDNPEKTLMAPNQRKGILYVHGNKTYHLNLILKYTSNEGPIFKRFRLVLDRNGIKRIEEVMARKSEILCLESE